jgi:hypothetical protein
MSTVNGTSTSDTARAGDVDGGSLNPTGRRSETRRRTARATTPPPPTPPRTRRRPGLLAAGVALVALGALAAAYLTQVIGNTVPVVAVVQTVQAGEVIDRADLAVANVAADPALAPVAAGRLDSFVGQRAAVDLSAGSLLTEQAVTEGVVPPAGRSLVGVALTSAQLPAAVLQPGDRVRVVDTPPAQGEPPSTTPTTIPGEVASVVGPDDTGLTVVNLIVADERAADLAARVATGRVALVLDSRER